MSPGDLVEIICDCKPVFSSWRDYPVAADIGPDENYIKAGSRVRIICEELGAKPGSSYLVDVSKLGAFRAGTLVTEMLFFANYLKPIPPLTQLAEAAD